ncbi:MAG TPA: peptidyl-prolyl cis-trans isomerase [Terriglobales bacterium]|jgi:peptidyl-prolyl cis-trans isomerase C|nr:peptidyl-prolyl cis-trans isomerase [Terriglobales bacterium]
MSAKAFLFRLLLTGLITPLVALPSTAQTPQPDTSYTTTPLPLTTTLPRNYPVITAQGVCSAGKPGGQRGAKSGCPVVVTRAEFEELVEALNPKMLKKERHDLAQNYAQLLALSQEAIRKGLDKEPRVRALVEYSRITALASAISKDIYGNAVAASPEQVQEYYQRHKANFDLFTFQRLFIPKEKQGESMSLEDAAKGDSPSSEAAMKALAESMHRRAVAGEDFMALQKEVFAQAGIKTEPDVNMQNVGRGSLPKAQEEIFDLAPGSISSVVTDDTGYYIYKLMSKQTPAFDSVREQVQVSMQNQGTHEAFAQIQKLSQAQVNESYFDKYDAPPPNPNRPDADDD